MYAPHGGAKLDPNLDLDPKLDPTKRCHIPPLRRGKVCRTMKNDEGSVARCMHLEIVRRDEGGRLRFPEQKIGSVRNIPEHCSRGRLFGTDWNRAGTGNDRKPSNPS